MALRIQFLFPNTLSEPLKSQTHPFSFPTATHFTKRIKTQIPCAKRRISDADLASDLATEVARINADLAQREEAMKKSKELLFIELCHYLAIEKEEVKRKWSKIDQQEKWVLLEGFVNEWGVNFHPLSIRSIREMIDEYLNEEKTAASNSSDLFPGLKRMMGFS
ncbi:hypothetical protein JCGZ_09909 [Jatropha curcas]|uniref:DUF7026 domain-containing protein n=1 Tax=Jatropha curcas TaxID=180498 RepID=A0A067KIJ2_JATCU|nr:uncharacterized protein LOC105636007 [Jatropha curcas]KDP35937.1 hypothetical protein JCGZ_09909 [Jatropha curcas]